MNNDDITISESELRGLSRIIVQSSPGALLGNSFENSDLVSSLALQKYTMKIILDKHY